MVRLATTERRWTSDGPGRLAGSDGELTSQDSTDAKFTFAGPAVPSAVDGGGCRGECRCAGAARDDPAGALDPARWPGLSHSHLNGSAVADGRVA